MEKTKKKIDLNSQNFNKEIKDADEQIHIELKEILLDKSDI